MIAYVVTQRTHEIGIRAALGASAGNILPLVLRGGMLLALMGLAIGCAPSLALTNLMASLLFGVKPQDRLSSSAAAALLVTISLLACCIPACRAAKVDPAVALRYE